MSSKSLSFNESQYQCLICEQEKQNKKNMSLQLKHFCIFLINAWQYVGQLNQQLPFVRWQLWIKAKRFVAYLTVG